jgi:hypothetical protein
MSDRPCQHGILRELNGFPDVTRARLARCVQHSQIWAGGAVWVWSTQPLPPARCLCDAADRFLVATEPATGWWRQSADVVLGRPQPTVHDALNVAEHLAQLPGRPLVGVPAGRDGTVFCTHADRVLVAADALCAVCLYPWLAGGHRLPDLVVSRYRSR